MRAITVLTAVLIAAPLQAPMAQKAPKLPSRPKLESSRDTNDWRSYYNHGIEWIVRAPDDAADAFYWATRLDPSQAAPYYARGLALLVSNNERYFQYLNGVKYVVESRDVQEADSLRYEGIRRDPFMQNTLDQRVFEEVLQRYTETPVFMRPGRDPESQGYAAYNKGQMGLAAARFTDAVNRNPDNLSLRVMRAHALAMAGEGDSAIVELTRVVEQMHKKDQKKLVSRYQSKAQFEYEMGVIGLMADKADVARAAFGRALVEDLAFYQAHHRLGQLSMVTGDTVAALAEFGQAAELRPDDGYMQFENGVALLLSKRYAEAEPFFRKAIALEPYYAPSYFNLAITLDIQEKKREAIEPYKMFAARAAQTLARQIDIAKSRAESYKTTPIPEKP